jgi:hypothetical protein
MPTFGSWSLLELPNLTPSSCEITSSQDTLYNCIAWAAEDNQKNWWPDPMEIGYWPAGVPRTDTRGAFIQAFKTLGYEPCLDGALQPGMQKIAIFGIGQSGLEVPTHAALQLESGEWTSKLGNLEDVRHRTLHAVNGPLYGKAICYLSRRRP